MTFTGEEMPGIEEGDSVWRVHVKEPGAFDKVRVKELGKGVKITIGRIRGTKRWEVQSYLFDRAQFEKKEQVRQWLDQHLKAQIQTLLDFKAWNEFRRQAVNTYLQISSVD